MRRLFLSIVATIAVAGIGTASPALAQIQSIDPDSAIDADLNQPSATQSAPEQAQPGTDHRQTDAQGTYQDAPPADSGNAPHNDIPPASGQQPDVNVYGSSSTYGHDDLIGAAEGVFGQGAEGLAGIIESILRDQGEPNAYIAGREASGAFILGLRYGSGTLFHHVEGQRRVYWTGPSIGFDVGGDAAKVFVLVYNLYDTHDLFQRFPGGEGRAYFFGGFSATYLRSGNIVLIPVRLGVGMRLGINAGYMKFTERQRWLPF